MTGSERVLQRLKQGPASAAELYDLGVIVHSRVSDLRRRGHVITCERVDGEGAAGYLYSLERGGETVGGLSAPPRSSESGAGTIPPAFQVEPIEVGTPLGSTPQLSFEDAA